MTFAERQRVTVVEQRDRQPRPGGDRHLATVVDVNAMYVFVTYDDPGVYAGKRDMFYAESGWRAWDGELRWRLAPVPDAGWPVRQDH